MRGGGHSVYPWITLDSFPFSNLKVLGSGDPPAFFHSLYFLMENLFINLNLALK